MDWWEGDMTFEGQEPKEILMILQPRAIPEAIESLNALDIEKVWFRGYTEVELETHLNEFIQTTDYDYYWIIADDVVVDEKPIELLRPLLHEGKVVSGYCLLGEDTDRVNLSNSKIMNFATYFDAKSLRFFRQLRSLKLTSGYEFNRPEISSGYVWVDEVLSNSRNFEEATFDEVNQRLGTDEFSFVSQLEVNEMNDDYFLTNFTGWSFTGMPRSVWLDYPYRTSSMNSNTDAQFSLRYAVRDGKEIWTHKDAHHKHLKTNQNATEISHWILGLEEPVIHFGDGKLVGENIPSELIWRLGDGEE